MQDFSSYPPQLEQSFVVYEQRTVKTQRDAWTLGWIVGGLFFLIVVGISFGVEPNHKDMSKSMDMSNLSTKKGQ